VHLFAPPDFENNKQENGVCMANMKHYEDSLFLRVPEMRNSSTFRAKHQKFRMLVPTMIGGAPALEKLGRQVLWC
jgi:hypothetical protein